MGTRAGETERRVGFALVLLACGSLSASGCFGGGTSEPFYPPPGSGAAGTGGAGSGSDGGGGAGPSGCASTTASAFKVRWTIQDTAGAPLNCAAVRATFMDIDVLNVATSVDYHDTFPCSDFAATTCPLPAGTYSVAMRLRNAAGDLLSEAIDPTQEVIDPAVLTDLGVVPFVATGAPIVDQYITLSWAIEKDANGAPLTCAQANAATVELDDGTSTFQWACAPGTGRTATVAPGLYAVAVSLLDPDGVLLSMTPTAEVQVVAGRVANLGAVVFGVR